MPRLEAEIDFNNTPGKVALRIYEFDADNDRQILRSQRLHNMASRMKKATDPDYPEPDNRLLRYLSAELANPAVVRKNLNVLTMNRRNFDRLAARFEDVPNRFVMVGTKQPYASKAVTAGLHFELNCQGKETVLSAMVDLPGHSRAWAHVRRDLSARGRELIVDGRQVELELPVDRELLDRVFGQDNPRVPTDAIEQHLPVLLSHRLDLLRGPSVKREQRDGKARLVLRTEGADVRLRPMIGDAMLRLKASAPVCALKRIGRQFLVIEYGSKAIDGLRQFMQTVGAMEKDEHYLLPAKSKDIKTLCRAFAKLPDAIETDVSPELQELLRGPQKLNLDVRAEEGAGWFQLDLGVSLGDTRLELRELRDLADRADDGVVRTRSGAWLQLDAAALKEVLGSLAELEAFDKPRRSTAEAKGVLDRVAALPNLQWHKSAKALADDVRRQPDAGAVPLSAQLEEVLRDYQRAGIGFIYNRCCYGVGALLADDMGLGKTVQVLAALEALKQQSEWRRALVVCPASVMTVWQEEAAKFCPELQVELLWGRQEQRQDVLTSAGDVLVCTYAVARNDVEFLSQMEWSIVVLDEAQQIKNPDAQVTRAIKSLPAQHRIALTGTPLENRLEDLWSIVDFLNPGYFGTLKDFRAVYGKSSWRRERLPRRLRPLMLRRTKDEVAPELPPRIEETISMPLDEAQARLYAEQLALARERVAGKGTMEILAALLRLRQVCCHPLLLNEKAEEGSAKFDSFFEMLAEILHEGHSVLVFSQFTSMLEIIARELDERDWHYFTLTGETPTRDRQYLVRKFNESKHPSVFLLSLRAAGTGLTLSKADYVFIYDPWWNPAVENQAIDRTHRIGQDKPVMAYRLITAGTVEEKVAHLQEEKRQLFAETIDAVDAVPEALSADELRKLLM